MKKGGSGKATAADVAAAAGVSASTVSRVLNDVETSFISEKTVQLVRKAADELRYKPNPIARALRLQRTNLLGLIVREIADPFFAEFIATLNTQARDLGYQVILGHAHSDPKEGLVMNEVLDARHCDGILILGDLRDDEQALQQMIEGNRAIVALCRGSSPTVVATINTDNRAGIRQLLNYLYGIGHRHFAFIDGGWLGDIRARRQAFQEYVAERGLPLLDDWMRIETDDAAGGYRAMQCLLGLTPRPTAVLASDDMMAIGVLRAVSDAGLKTPDDVSVVGFDDISIGRFISPSLTTVRQPVEDMCRHALSILLKLIQGEPIPAQERLLELPPEVILRESVGPPPVNTRLGG